MELNQVEIGKQIESDLSTINSDSESYVAIEAEVPEPLYLGMNDFICTNPSWDKYKVLSSAIATFLVQNGCRKRSVTEKYLNDLFKI